jgi:hypothetical protein
MGARSASHERRFLNVDQLTKFIQTREAKRINLKKKSARPLWEAFVGDIDLLATAAAGAIRHIDLLAAAAAEAICHIDLLVGRGGSRSNMSH